MKAALRFDLFSGPAIVGLAAPAREYLVRVQGLYCKYRVDPQDHLRPAFTLEVASRKDDFRVETPWLATDIHPCEGGFKVRHRRKPMNDGGLADEGPVDREHFVPRQSTLDERFPANSTILHVGVLIETVLLKSLCFYDRALECFHAACVRRDGHCVMFIGPSGIGKTTTAIAFCARGWQLVADDVSLVDVQATTVKPLDRAIVSKHNACPPGLESICECRRADGQRRLDDEPSPLFFVRPEYLAPDRPYALSDVVFLTGLGRLPRIRQVGAIAGAMRLSRASFVALDDATQRLCRYANGLGGVRWWECDLGDPLTTVAAITARLGAAVS